MANHECSFVRHFGSKILTLKEICFFSFERKKKFGENVGGYYALALHILTLALDFWMFRIVVEELYLKFWRIISRISSQETMLTRMTYVSPSGP
jgi:hypothetical protein